MGNWIMIQSLQSQSSLSSIDLTAKATSNLLFITTTSIFTSETSIFNASVANFMPSLIFFTRALTLFLPLLASIIVL